MVLATSLARRCRRDDLEVHRHFHLQSILALVVVFTMSNFSICLLWEVESVAQSWKSLEDGECQEHRLKLPEIPYVEAVSWKFLNIETGLSYIGWYIGEAGAASLTIGLCIHNLFAVLVEWISGLFSSPPTTLASFPACSSYRNSLFLLPWLKPRSGPWLLEIKKSLWLGRECRPVVELP